MEKLARMPTKLNILIIHINFQFLFKLLAMTNLKQNFQTVEFISHFFKQFFDNQPYKIWHDFIWAQP